VNVFIIPVFQLDLALKAYLQGLLLSILWQLLEFSHQYSQLMPENSLSLVNQE
jgi:hypothetical protein